MADHPQLRTAGAEAAVRHCWYGTSASLLGRPERHRILVQT
jgi:hypothetical protein